MNRQAIYLWITFGALCLNVNGQSSRNPGNSVPDSIMDNSTFRFSSEHLEKPQLIIPEGNMVIDRKSKLARHKDGRWFLVMVPEKTPSKKNKIPTEPPNNITSISGNDNTLTKSPENSDHFTLPLEILPNKWLTSMVKACGDKENLDITFRVWGEVTVYKKRNYMLLTLVATGSPFGDPAATPKIKAVSKLDSMFGNSPEESLENQQKKQEEEKQKLLLAENIRNRLLAIDRPHTLKSDQSDNSSRNNSATNDNPSTSSNQSSLKTDNPKWKDGKWISNQLGRLRLNKKDLFYEFVFESGNTPIIVHPCQALESMETKINRSTRSVKFKISGKISVYKNNFYLLPKTQMETTGSGNLGR